MRNPSATRVSLRHQSHRPVVVSAACLLSEECVGVASYALCGAGVGPSSEVLTQREVLALHRRSSPRGPGICWRGDGLSVGADDMASLINTLNQQLQ